MLTTDIFHVHSIKAWHMLKPYKIGTVGPSKMKMGSDVGIPIYISLFFYAKKKDLENLIDKSKAVLPQVIHMKDPSKYQLWIHSVQISTLRIFQIDILEKLSHYPWWYIFPLWIPMIFLNLYLAQQQIQNIFGVIFRFFIGLISWSLMEYFLHRYVFHIDTKSIPGNFFHFFAHGIHHLSPLDTTRLTFPPYFSIVIGIIIYSLSTRFFSLQSGVQAWFAGLITGYMFYDTLHYYFHHEKFLHWVPLIGQYVTYMKSRHLAHHYKNPNKNYGVSSPFFDYVFGTSY